MSNKFLSGRIKELLLGIAGRTEDKTVLQTTGTVGIGTTNSLDYTLYVDGSANIDGGVNVTGVSTFQDRVIFDSTNSIQIPSGTEAQKDAVGVAVTGQVRFNTTNQQFEGFGVGNNWGSLGGVKDVDGDTEIKAELSAGSDEDALFFYTGGNLSGILSTTSSDFNVDVNIDGNFNVTGVSAFTGDVSITDKIVHTGNTGTAIRFPAANRFTVETGGVEALRVDGSQRVGIGTDDLQARFTVYSTSNNTFTREIRIDASDAPSGGSGVGLFKIVGDGHSLGKYIIGYNSNHPSQANDVSLKNSDGDISFHTASNAIPAEKVRITTTGRVGINQSSPDYTLDLGESASTIRLVSENNGTALRVGAGGGSNDVTLIRVDGDLNNHDGESDSAQYGFSIKYMGSRNNVTNSLSVFSDNQNGTQVEAITIFQDGRVGLNSTSPSERLDVGGTTQTEQLNVTGVSTFQGNVFLGDNDKINLGDGNDLKLWHNGSNSIINDEGVGDLYLGGNSSVNITNAALSEFKAKFITDGAVELYYDNSKKFETTGIGVSVSSGAGLTATIAGPTNLILDPAAVGDNTGIVRIKGDLYVDGTEVKVDSTTINLADLKIGIATAVGTNLLLDGGGIGIGSANIEKTILWNNSNSRMEFNADLYAPNFTTGDLNITHTETDTLRVSGVSTFQSHVELGDDDELRIGDNKDLRLYHDGSNSYVADNGVGSLILASTFGGVLIRKHNVNETMAGFNPDSSVDLYFNGDKKFETTASGIDVTGHTETDTLRVSGVSTFTGSIHLPDSSGDTVGRALFGDSDDLRIYHDGNNSIIQEVGAGDLRLSGNVVKLNNGNNTATMVKGTDGGSVELNHNGSKKFETTGYGVTVFGTTETQQLNVSGVSTFQNNVHLLDNDKLLIGGSVGTHDGLEIYHDGNHSYIDDSGTGNLHLRSGTLSVQNLAGSKTSAVFQSGSSQQFYFNNSKKFETTASGIDVTGHTETDTLRVSGVSTFQDDVKLTTDNKKLIFGSGEDLKIFHDGNANYIVANNGSLNLKSDTYSYLKALSSNGKVQLYHSNSVKFETTGVGVTVFGTTETQQLNVSGISTFQGNVHLGDNDRLRIGDGNDLELYHDGTDDFIRSSGTTLKITGTRVVVNNAANNENQAVFTAGGSVALYHNASKKFETTASGIDVTGHTETDTFQVSGIATFGNAVSAGGTTGTDGQYLKSTGVGVTWASFPTLRTTQTSSAANGQTTFNFTYNVNFLDVFINGVKLTSSEYTASNGTSVVLATPAFENDVVEFHSYNTTSTGASGGGASNLNGLSDVTISSLADDHILQYNSSTNVFENVAAPYATTASVGLATAGLASEAFVGLSTSGLASEAFVGLSTAGLASEAFVGLATAGLASEAFVGLATAGLTNEAFVGLATVGLLTATGDASNLTGLTGASAATYGNSTAVPQITVDANGRITGISNVLISGGGGGGTSIIVNDSQSLVGTAGTIDFGTGLSVSPVSAGIVTVTVNGSQVDAGTLGGSALTALQKNDADTDLVMNNQILHFGAANTKSRIRWSGTTSLWDLVDGDLKFRDNLTDRFTFERTTGNFTATGSVSATSFSGDGSALTGITTTTAEWTLGANGSSDYTFTGPGVADGAQDPTIYLVRGQTYKFKNRTGSHPFRIQYEFQNTGGTAYTDGIVISDGSSASSGAGNNADLYWEVRNDAPDLLHYQCTSHTSMSGRIVILGDVVTNGSWTAAAGVLNNIDTITGIANNNFKSAEYMVHISNGGNMQTQKVLVMQNGTTASSTEYAIIYDNSLLVSIGASVHGGNFYLNATPETGITGITTFRFTRQTIR